MRLCLVAKIRIASEEKLKFLKEKYSKELTKLLDKNKFKSTTSDEIIEAAMNISIEATKTTTENGKPTYAEWVCKQILNGSVLIGSEDLFKETKELEDGPVLIDSLKQFHSIKNKDKFKKSYSNDINAYKTKSNLYETVREALKEISPIKESDVKRTVGHTDIKGAKTLYKGEGNPPDVIVYYIEGTAKENVDALIQLGGKVPGEERRLFNTSWCTINPKRAKDYLKEGSLLVIFKNGEPFIQLHGGSSQFMDPDDRPIRKIKGMIKELNQILKKIPKENRHLLMNAMKLNEKLINSLDKDFTEDEKAYELMESVLANRGFTLSLKDILLL